MRQLVQLYGLSYGLPESLFEEKAARYSELFEVTDKLDQYPSELSKGMRQKVNLISCLLTLEAHHNPRLAALPLPGKALTRTFAAATWWRLFVLTVPAVIQVIL